MRHLSAISQCWASWTGSVTVTPAAGLATTVVPRQGDSVASLLQRLVQALRVRTDASWSWRFVADATFVLEASVEFSWAATDDVATRTGLDAADSDAGVVAGDTAAAGVWIPDDGASTRPNISCAIGSPTGTGAAVSPLRPQGAGALTLAGLPGGDLPDIETGAVGVFDVADPAGRVWHRQLVSGWVRTYPGTSPVLASIAPDGPTLIIDEVPS